MWLGNHKQMYPRVFFKKSIVIIDLETQKYLLTDSIKWKYLIVLIAFRHYRYLHSITKINYSNYSSSFQKYKNFHTNHTSISFTFAV